MVKYFVMKEKQKMGKKTMETFRDLITCSAAPSSEKALD